VPLGSSSRVQCTLQAATPAAKHDWLLELQNVKLALGQLTCNCPLTFIYDTHLIIIIIIIIVLLILLILLSSN